MLNFFPTSWFSIETARDFAILLCHNECFCSFYGMVLIHVHMRTFCNIFLNHWHSLLSKHYKKKHFLLYKNTILFILHTVFHYNIAIPCAYVECCFALSFFNLFCNYIQTQTSKKGNVATISIYIGGNWGIQKFELLPNSTCVVVENQVRSPVFYTLSPVYPLL